MILFFIYLNLEEFGSYFSATYGVFMYVYRQAGGLGWIWIFGFPDQSFSLASIKMLPRFPVSIPRYLRESGSHLARPSTPTIIRSSEEKNTFRTPPGLAPGKNNLNLSIAICAFPRQLPLLRVMPDPLNSHYAVTFGIGSCKEKLEIRRKR